MYFILFIDTLLCNIVCSLVMWRRWKEKQGCKTQHGKAAHNSPKTLDTACVGTSTVTHAEILPETNKKELEIFKLSENIAYTSSVEYKKDAEDGYETIPV